MPVVAGLQTRRIGKPEALAAIGGGVAALIAARLAPWERAPEWMDPLSPSTWGLIVSIAACALVLALRRGDATA